jgi:microcystin-dependent protein
VKKTVLTLAVLYAFKAQACWTYSFQSFSTGEVLGASKMNQIEVNIRDHRHGVDSGLSEPLLPGFVIAYAGSTEPTGWLFCYGQAISRSTYASLFAVVSTTYGVGDGSTTFNVPDIRGRVIAGKDNMGGSAANRITGGGSGITGTTLGASGGAETVTISTTTMPSHSHTEQGSSHPAGSSFFYITRALTDDSVSNQSTNNSTAASGSGGAHNNVQPTFILNYLIKT